MKFVFMHVYSEYYSYHDWLIWMCVVLLTTEIVRNSLSCFCGNIICFVFGHFGISGCTLSLSSQRWNVSLCCRKCNYRSVLCTNTRDYLSPSPPLSWNVESERHITVSFSSTRRASDDGCCCIVPLVTPRRLLVRSIFPPSRLYNANYTFLL